MANQTFKLIGSDQKEIGYISKTEDQNMIIVLNSFWGSLISKDMKLINVDDFVGSIFGDGKGVAIVECENCGHKTLMVHFDGNRYTGSVKITVSAPFVGKIFSVMVENFEDVTGRVMI